MIEPSAVATPCFTPTAQEGTEPVRFKLPDIRFEGEHLWLARYESLVDYARVHLPDRARVEPSFRLASEASGTIEMELTIASPSIGFRTHPGSKEVIGYDIAGPDQPVPGLVELRLGPDDRHCKLVWDLEEAEADVTTLRILCAGGKAATEREKALAAVEGGIFLTLMKSFSPQPVSPCPSHIESGARPPFVILAEASSRNGGGIEYSIFHPEVYRELPAEIHPEPAFRVSPGGSFHFGMELGSTFPEPLTLVPDCSPDLDEIRVVPRQPKSRSKLRELAPTKRQEHGRRCALRWERTSTRSGTEGSVAAFTLAVEDPPDGLGTHLCTIDPTIIQPPPCDPITGTCLP